MFFVSFHAVFFTEIAQKSEKIVKFFAIFSRCVSISYKKFEKKVAQNP